MRRIIPLTIVWLASGACAAPPLPSGSDTAPAVPAEAEISATFSHEDWTKVLEKFVDDRGRVDYRGLAGDRAVFDRYLRQVETVSPETDPDRFPTREDRLAYYLNAYNAQVFQGVLERGPEEESVWSGLVSGLNFFGRMKVTLGGKKMNLKTLEDRYVRERFQDPRVHAALNCASIGCPRLPRKAFEAETLGRDLDAGMRAFVADPKNVEIDPVRKQVRLSKIFDWFEEDFLAGEKRLGNGNPTILDAVNRYRKPGARIPPGYEVEFKPYDKRINKQ